MSKWCVGYSLIPNFKWRENICERHMEYLFCIVKQKQQKQKKKLKLKERIFIKKIFSH